MLPRIAAIILGVFFALPAHAFFVTVNFSGSASFSGIAGASPVTTTLTYETSSATVTDLSVNFTNAIGNPSTTITGPLQISSSSIVVNGLRTTDFYDFFINIVNGPILKTTQSNGFERSAQLTQVHFNSGQNTDPIPDNTLDENLFPAFVPRSGVQPQRMFLNFTASPTAPLNVGATVTHNPTSVSVSEVPLPPGLALMLSGMLGAAFLRYRRA